MNVAQNWKLQYLEVGSQNIYEFLTSIYCLDCDRPPKSWFEVFFGGSNVDFCGEPKFPVSKCRFHFERVETLVFSCVVISSRYVEALRLFTLLLVLPIPRDFVFIEDFSVMVGVKVRFLLNSTFFFLKSKLQVLLTASYSYICMNYARRFQLEK